MVDPDCRAASAGVLHLWERGAALAPHRRALLLADEGAPAFGLPQEGAPRDEPLGRHHARLLHLRTAAFGSDLDATAPCPRCGEAVEFTLDAAAITARDTVREPVPVEHDGYHLTWRSPSAIDFAAAADAADGEDELLHRCVLSATGPAGAVIDPTRLPAAVRATLAAAMEDADPLAELVVDAACPACEFAFRCDVDVPAFVWTEVEAHAKQVLLDVDALARAYGWTEPDVLALSDSRRAAYLRIVAEGMP